jgi:hypothetical protein
MDEIALFAELLFLVLFSATTVGWIGQRDPISLDLSLIFSGLGLLFVLQLWERVTGVEPPTLLSQAVTLRRRTWSLCCSSSSRPALRRPDVQPTA